MRSSDPDRWTDDTDEAIAREAVRARARRAAGGGAEEAIPPLTRQEEHDARMRRARHAAWSYTPSLRTSRNSAGGFVGGLVLELVIALGFHLLWPVLVRWMSFRRAAGIVAGAGLGMLCGALVLPRLAFPESRSTDGDMVGVLLKGEVVAITLAVLVLGFGGMFIALFASQARTRAQAALEQDSEREASPAEHAARRGDSLSVARHHRRLVERALLSADPVAVAVTWFLLATLLTGQFFFSPGITVAEHVAGKTPPSYYSLPAAGYLVLGTLLTIPLALALGAMASKVSSPAPGGRAAGG